MGGRAAVAVAARRRQLVLPRAQQQEDAGLAVIEAAEEQPNARIAAGNAVAAATNRWVGGIRWHQPCAAGRHRPLEGLGGAPGADACSIFPTVG